MYTSRDERQFRLEYWNGKTYDVARIGKANDLRPEGERRPWRLTLVEKARALKPRYIARRPNGSSRTQSEVIEQYMRWAKSKGLSAVTVYADGPRCWVARQAAAKHGLACIPVMLADFLGKAPADEADAPDTEAYEARI
jgi:hypothetical protein